MSWKVRGRGLTRIEVCVESAIRQHVEYSKKSKEILIPTASDNTGNIRTNKQKIALSAGAVEYTGCFSAEGKDPLPTSVLDMTLNNLVRLK